METRYECEVRVDGMVAAEWHELEALVTYMHDQAMIAETMPVDEFFVPTYGHTSPAY